MNNILFLTELMSMYKTMEESEMETLVVAGFPGTGKSVLFKAFGENRVADSDSSQFSWISSGMARTRNPEFPNNYIEHIKSLMGKVAVICVSTHDVVRQALKDNGIEYILVYPARSSKLVYLENYKKRGNDEAFIELMDKNWDKFIDQLEQEDGAKIKLRLIKNTYIKDIPGIVKDINKN